MRSTGTVWSTGCRPEVRNNRSQTQSEFMAQDTEGLAINLQKMSFEFTPSKVSELFRSGAANRPRHLRDLACPRCPLHRGEGLDVTRRVLLLSCRAEAEAGANNEEPDGHGSADPCPGSAEVTRGPGSVWASLHGEVCTWIQSEKYKKRTFLLKVNHDFLFIYFFKISGALVRKTWPIERNVVQLWFFEGRWGVKT